MEFSFTGCKPCLDALPEISEIISRFGASLEVISIWNDKSRDIWLNGAKKHKELIRWTDLWDKTGKVTQLYEVKVWPTYILISPEGKIEKTWNSYRKGRILSKMEALFGNPRP
ncbi:MAG: redoxin domain-containing protein [Algoriphagus sp.]|uniref:TlpA family protein disulfide reductase n=1 Tax=Algoriphagus sp. TaxID=1872435 RepID=UPI00184C6649|nr:thioredoxin family protein [Algoriphagus sp.]NVJ86418.1 redoxin domain-containing protein [Algoriphagus sp.]